MQINKEIESIYSEESLIDILMDFLLSNSEYISYSQKIAESISNTEEEELIE